MERADAERARDIRRDVAAELVADKWTIAGNESVSDDSDNIPLLTRPKLGAFFAIPSPYSTFTMPNQVHGALTGLSEGRRTDRMLARNRVIELDEGAGCKTIVTAGDDWRPMLPEDVWPRLRLISMLDAARMKYGDDILPLSVPVEVGCRWAFGSRGGGDADARAQREEQLRALLARLRASVRVDFRALARCGRIDVARIADEFDLSPVQYSCVFEGPLFNTEYQEWSIAQVNRNGQVGKCFTVFNWPADYLYGIAIGYARRIPDALTDLLEPGAKRVYEGPGMLAVKSYLLTRIVEMYGNPKLPHVVALDELYAWIGAVDPPSRRRVRERCERYLSSWIIPRTVNDPYHQYPLISGWEPVPKGARTPTGYKVSLVRGGLGRLLSV